MELQEIAHQIAAADASLLSGTAKHIDFRVGELLCRVARVGSETRYFYRTLYPVRAASAEDLASIAFGAQQPSNAGVATHAESVHQHELNAEKCE